MWSALLLALGSLRSQGQSWTNSFEDRVLAWEHAGQQIAIDGNDDVIVLGTANTRSRGKDMLFLKYSNSGEILWTSYYDPGTSVTDLAVDTSGNVAALGLYKATSTTYANVLLCYSSAGIPTWTNAFSAAEASTNGLSTLAFDASGNIICLGWALASGTNYDMLLQKYSPSGELLWTHTYDSLDSRNDSGTGLALDRMGNVLLAGTSYSGSYADGFMTLKCSNDGVPLWTNTCTAPATAGYSCRPFSVAVDSKNNIIVGARAYGSMMTVKYASDGQPLWTNYCAVSIGAMEYRGSASAMAVGPGDAVYITGYTWSVGPGMDFITAGYSSEGKPLWTNLYDSAYDVARHIATDSSGKVIVTGEGGYGGNYLTVVYSAGGELLSAIAYDPAGGPDAAFHVAVDSRNNVFVTGRATIDRIWPDYKSCVTIKYEAHKPLPRPTLSIAVVNTDAILCWSNASYVLQSAAEISGAFTNISGASSPFTNSFAHPKRFFRLSSE